MTMIVKSGGGAVGGSAARAAASTAAGYAGRGRSRGGLSAEPGAGRPTARGTPRGAAKGWDPGTRVARRRTLLPTIPSRDLFPAREGCPDRALVASRRMAQHGSSRTVFREGSRYVSPGDTGRPARTRSTTGDRRG